MLPLQKLLTSFMKFWSHFKVLFWYIGDKRNESNWRKQIKLMMIQMHNERSNAISLDWDLEVVEVKSKWRNERNCKKELKNHVFQFRMNIRKIRTVVQNEIEWALAAAHHGKIENRYHTVMRNAPRRQNSCWCVLHFAQSCELLGAHAKLYFLQIPWWKRLWKTS